MKELDVKQENERKKEYLDGYRKCVRQLDRLNEELSEIRINKMFPSLIQDGMPHAHTTTDLSGYAARIDKIERKIVKALLQYSSAQFPDRHLQSGVLPYAHFPKKNPL